MKKIIFCIFIMISPLNTSFAAELELSDIIKEARQSEILKLSEAKTNKSTIQPVKNDIPSETTAQNSKDSQAQQNILMQRQTTSTLNK